MNMLKIVAISDTHNKHKYLDLPEGDILIHAGDFTSMGSEAEVAAFGEWLQDLPYKYIIITYGNHDWLGQRNPDLAEKLLGKAIILHDRGVEIEGIKFYGSAWQPEFCNWAFNVPRGAASAANWAKIPEDTDVLITHGPPFGTLDLIHTGGLRMENVGCEALADRIKALSKLKFHVFGHIHECHGQVTKDKVTYVNAAFLNDAYVPAYPPEVFEV